MRRCDSCRNEKKPLKRLAGRLLCKECEDTKFFDCEICKKSIYVHGFAFFSEEHKICNTCGLDYYACETCGEVCEDNEFICGTCHEKSLKKTCPICEVPTNNYEDKVLGDEIYCIECFLSKFALCSECNQHCLISQVKLDKLPHMCLTCMKECEVID